MLGTSSSESALPRIMEKLERIGCPKPVVGLVVPTGYSFNLDGTSIYMTMAAVFVAQASGVHLSFGEQLSMLGDPAADVEGRGGGDRQRLHHAGGDAVGVPATSRSPALALLLGVDRFMSEARAITNLIGNAVATMAIARWDNALDLERARGVLARHGEPGTILVDPVLAPEP